jgi:N-acetylmuramic acid 6-phosphate etherase
LGQDEPEKSRIGSGRGLSNECVILAREDHLLTESRKPRSESIDALSPLEIVRLMNSEDARVVEAVGAEAASIARAIEWAADRLRRGGRLIYAGAGTSGRLGVLDAAECPPTSARS